MKYIADKSSIFSKRLYFETLRELDDECERLVRYTHFTCFNRELELPISDDRLTTMIERHADIDLYAEMPPGIEASTDFRPDVRPLVRMSATIAGNSNRRNRLRTGLAHEWFHAVYHRPLWEILWARARVLGESIRPSECHQDAMIGAAESDWLEFQAAYASCALLVPRSALETFVGREPGEPVAIAAGVAEEFEVSLEAARWRLRHLAMGERTIEK
jgi:hypothetical protein